MKNFRPRLFITHLEILKGEFESMSEEIDTLRKERDQYREKGRCSILPGMELLLPSLSWLSWQSKHKKRNSRIFGRTLIVSDVKRELGTILKALPHLGKLPVLFPPNLSARRQMLSESQAHPALRKMSVHPSSHLAQLYVRLLFKNPRLSPLSYQLDLFLMPRPNPLPSLSPMPNLFLFHLIYPLWTLVLVLTLRSATGQ